LKYSGSSERPLKHLKATLKTSLETLTQYLEQKMDRARYSESVFLMALSSIVSGELFKLKTLHSKQTVEKLRRLHEQFRVSLNLLYNLSGVDENSPELMFLFTAGYAVLHADSFNAEEVKTYVKLLSRVFVPESNYTETDVEAVRIQSEQIFRKLSGFKFTKVASILTELTALNEILQTISENIRKSGQSQYLNHELLPQNSLGGIVLGDLLGVRTFHRYEAILTFCYSLNSAKSLRNYLAESVINRHHIVPDYKTRHDILKALSSGEVYFIGSNDAFSSKKVKIIGFYFLAKYVNRKNNPDDKERAVIALKEIAWSHSSTLSMTLAVYEIAKFLEFSDVRDSWFQQHELQDFRISLPMTKKKYLETVFSERWSRELFTAIAVSVITDFKHPLIHQVIAEFAKKDYDNFCAGTDELRQFLKQKAKSVPKM
jgi:hypothetical protein